ncbi:MAG: 16S rRNA (uracil(1498)-N(3))-methyltransferase [Rikenellaceae bacterium]|nr:16S rRNA (uracil(1498)-N(3))-methyltransferase [Rikenellaceae bacterium]
MQLFYAPGFVGDFYTLTEEESAHCVKVLRARKGDILTLTDGCGTKIVAEVVESDRKCTSVRVLERVADAAPLGYRLVVACAPTKNIDRFEWFVEKAVEVGVSAIVPIACQNSERRAVKQERLTKIAVSAMKQSLKYSLPVVEPMCDFADFIKRDFAAAGGGVGCGGYVAAPQLFIAHCDPCEDKRLLRDMIVRGGNVAIAIGPEGDFSPEEVAMARDAGFGSVSLGESRLRTETAALAAVMTVSLLNQGSGGQG